MVCVRGGDGERGEARDPPQVFIFSHRLGPATCGGHVILVHPQPFNEPSCSARSPLKLKQLLMFVCSWFGVSQVCRSVSTDVALLAITR